MKSSQSFARPAAPQSEADDFGGEYAGSAHETPMPSESVGFFSMGNPGPRSLGERFLVVIPFPVRNCEVTLRESSIW